jgi:hypothetical protein
MKKDKNRWEELFKDYTDRIDSSARESLIEYGIIRNPKNNQTIFFNQDLKNPKFCVHHYDFSDVLSELQRISYGYFKCMDSTLEKEEERLNNDYITDHIHCMDMYSSDFCGSYFPFTIRDIINKVKGGY